MKLVTKLLAATTFAVFSLTLGASAGAQVIQAPVAQAATVTLDENGNGFARSSDGLTVFQSALLADPGPGGLSSVLTYTLPRGVTVVSGDVFLQDLVNETLQILDLIRFNPATDATAASIAFYSDNIGGSDAIADTVSPPGSFYSNTVTLREVGLEGLNGAIYTPTANQPGFVSGFNVTYRFISDGSAVPEPATWAMMLLGFGMIGASVRYRRRSAKAVHA